VAVLVSLIDSDRDEDEEVEGSDCEELLVVATSVKL
jgi:hypothetical protein